MAKLLANLALVVFVVLTTSCTSKPPEENSQPETYQLTTQEQMEKMQLTDGEARKALLIISDVTVPNKSVFDGIPQIFIIKVEGSGHTSYRACLSTNLPSVEIGEGRGWPRITRFRWPDGVNCLSVAKSGNEKADQWMVETGSTKETTIYTSRVSFKTVDTSKALPLFVLQ